MYIQNFYNTNTIYNSKMSICKFVISIVQKLPIQPFFYRQKIGWISEHFLFLFGNSTGQKFTIFGSIMSYMNTQEAISNIHFSAKVHFGSTLMKEGIKAVR